MIVMLDAGQCVLALFIFLLGALTALLISPQGRDLIHALRDEQALQRKGPSE